jgi:hypothetical protein
MRGDKMFKPVEIDGKWFIGFFKNNDLMHLHKEKPGKENDRALYMLDRSFAFIHCDFLNKVEVL